MVSNEIICWGLRQCYPEDQLSKSSQRLGLTVFSYLPFTHDSLASSYLLPTYFSLSFYISIPCLYLQYLLSLPISLSFFPSPHSLSSFFLYLSLLSLPIPSLSLSPPSLLPLSLSYPSLPSPPPLSPLPYPLSPFPSTSLSSPLPHLSLPLRLSLLSLTLPLPPSSHTTDRRQHKQIPVLVFLSTAVPLNGQFAHQRIAPSFSSSFNKDLEGLIPRAGACSLSQGRPQTLSHTLRDALVLAPTPRRQRHASWPGVARVAKGRGRGDIRGDNQLALTKRVCKTGPGMGRHGTGSRRDGTGKGKRGKKDRKKKRWGG